MKIFLLSFLISLQAFGASQTVNGTLTVNGRQEAVSITKGSHPCPTMSDAQMLSVASPANGDCVHNYTLNSWLVFNSTEGTWEEVGSGGGLSQWLTATNYEVGDIVIESNKIYKCLNDHVSTTFSTDLASNEWIRLNDEFVLTDDQGTVLSKEIEVPHNQLTQVDTGKSRLETGNPNRLINPGFEHSTVATGWSKSETGTATAAIAAEAPSPFTEGAQSGKFTCVGGASGGGCLFYQDVSTVSIQGMVRALLQSDTASGVKFYSRVNGTNNLYVDIVSTGKGVVPIPQTLGDTTTGIAVEITVAASQTINVFADDMFVGVEKVTADNPLISGWTDAGTITIGATTTPPTKGTIVVDNVKWRQVGDSYEVEFKYEHSTAGAAGSGDYLITLPSGLEFDSSIPSYTGTININNYNGAASARLGEGWIFYAGNAQGTANMIKYSATQFRVHAFNYYTSTGVFGSSFFQFSQANTSFHLKLSFKGKGIASSTSIYSMPSSDTSLASCGHTTSDFVGFGTVSNIETQCYRDGEHLVMTGTFTSGTPSSTEARISLKLNGTSYTSKSQTVGTKMVGVSQLGSVNATAELFGSSLTILSESQKTYITLGARSSGLGGLTKRNGDQLSLANGVTVSINARIPINTWENYKNIVGDFEQLAKVAVLKDVKTSGTAGGTFTSGAWQTRTLNTLEGGNSFVSLSSNQFTLTPGTYEIEAMAPAFIVNSHISKLRNITDSSDALIGTTMSAQASYNGNNTSNIYGIITISGSKIFEIQHRCQTTYGTSGFGNASSFSVSEVYTQVKIRKLK